MMRKQLFTIALLFPCSFTLHAQVAFVSDKELASPVHKANVGNIVFTAGDSPSTGYQEKDFLKTYRFTPKSSLYITAFFSHSLTNNLHRIAPESGIEELTKLGSCQFAFYVDDRLIHKDNLHPASLFPEQKNKETSISKPLIAHTIMQDYVLPAILDSK